MVENADVVDRLVVVVRVVVVDASGTHCPAGGLVGFAMEPSSDGVLGGLAHSGCENKCNN